MINATEIKKITDEVIEAREKALIVKVTDFCDKTISDALKSAAASGTYSCSVSTKPLTMSMSAKNGEIARILVSDYLKKNGFTVEMATDGVKVSWKETNNENNAE